MINVTAKSDSRRGGRRRGSIGMWIKYQPRRWKKKTKVNPPLLFKCVCDLLLRNASSVRPKVFTITHWIGTGLYLHYIVCGTLYQETERERLFCNELYLNWFSNFLICARLSISSCDRPSSTATAIPAQSRCWSWWFIITPNDFSSFVQVFSCDLVLLPNRIKGEGKVVIKSPKDILKLHEEAPLCARVQVMRLMMMIKGRESKLVWWVSQKKTKVWWKEAPKEDEEEEESRRPTDFELPN